MRRRKRMEKKVISVEQAYKEFMEAQTAKNLRKSTLDTYKLHIETYIQMAYGKAWGLPFGLSNHDFWNSFIILLQEEQKKNDVTINSYCRSVRVFLYWGMDMGYIESEPLNLPKFDKKIKEVYTADEITALLKKPEKGCSEVTYQTWVFINLIMSTGLRLGSALELKVSNFVKKEKLLYVQTTKQRTSQQIYLNDNMCLILSKYIREFDLNEDDYIFCIANGDIMKKRTMQDNVASYNRSRGVKKTSIHLMRHTFARNYYQETKDIYNLQQMLGHSQISTTENYIRSLGLNITTSTAYNPQEKYVKKEMNKRRRRARKM